MTKIDIISGFLGAGKTTLIKKLIKDVLHKEKIVLIENEFGEIGIDGGFLEDAGIEIREMNSGCFFRGIEEGACGISSGKDHHRAQRCRQAVGCNKSGTGSGGRIRNLYEQLYDGCGCTEMPHVYEKLR